MKTNWFIILLVTGLASCSIKEEETESPVNPAPLLLNSGIQQYSGTYIPLPEKTETGLFITSMGQPPTSATAKFYNLKFTADMDGILLGTSLVQLTQNESYTVYGYAPYRKEISDPESILFTYGTDVLGCSIPAEIRNVSSDRHTGTLQFMHCTAQIRFVVKITDEETTGELSATSVLKAVGFLPEGRLNITNGRLTGGGEPSESTAIKVAATYNGAEKKYTLESQAVCFFILQDAPQTIQLRVTHNGVTRTGNITQTFNPGESYTYTVYVGRQSELTLNAVLTPWINENETIEFD